MAEFTIEASYRQALFRQRTYQAETLERACQLAFADTDWSGRARDADGVGETYISGAWRGAQAAPAASSIPVPSQFTDGRDRKADHFETLLGVLKVLLMEETLTPAKQAFWRRRAERAVAKAEVILAGGPDPR